MNHQSVQASFWEWSIFNYFIQNYMETSFHKDCKGSETLCKEGDNFLSHFEDYLIQFCKIRGKWIDLFKFSAKQFKYWKHKNNSTTPSNSFFQLLDKLNLNEQHLIFIQFILKFFQFSSLENPHQGHTLMAEMSKLYFQYRIVISFSNAMVDVGAPPSLTRFLNLIFNNVDSFNHILYEDTESSLCPLRKLSIQCQFQHIFNDNLQKNSIKNSCADKINCKSQQFLLTPTKCTKPVDKKSVSSKYKSPISQTIIEKQKCQSQLNFQSSPKALQTQKTGQLKIEEQNESRKEISKRIQTIIFYKNAKRNQLASKIINTTRHSNFKGIFIKKSNKNLTLTKTTSVQAVWDQRQLMQPYKRKQKVKPKLQQDDMSSFDFLCDRSF